MTRATLRRGYVALITALMLSVMLATLAIVAAAAAISSRHYVSDAEDYLAAAHQARMCAALALVRLAQDVPSQPSLGHKEVRIGSNATCLMGDITAFGTHAEIKTSARRGHSMRHLMVEADVGGGSIPRLERWLEL